MRNRIGPVDNHVTSASRSLSASDSGPGVHRVNALVEHQVCIFGPERYEAKYEYPLIVWLHSCHSSEGELEYVMPSLSLQNYVACAPRAPLHSETHCGKFSWGKTNSATAVAEEIVFASIEETVKQFSINPQRIFLAGFGSGATMSLRLALRYPDQFAGVVAICGAFPQEECSLVRLHQARQLPILWMFGENSETCNITSVCDSLPLLHTASLSVDLRQYPCGDDLLSNMLSDANNWLMEHVTNQPVHSQVDQQESFSQN